jgi:hypothetical protein
MMIFFDGIVELYLEEYIQSGRREVNRGMLRGCEMMRK